MKFLKTILILGIVAITLSCSEDPYRIFKGLNIGTGGGGSGGGGSGGGGSGGDGGGVGEGSTINGGSLSNWGLLSLGSLNSVTTTGKGYDALIVYAPASKIESTSNTTDTKPISMSSVKNSSSIAPEESQYYQEESSNQDIANLSSSMSPEMAFHISLRIKENELIQKGLYNPDSAINKDTMPCNGSPVQVTINTGAQITVKSIGKSSSTACYYLQTGESIPSGFNKLKSDFENFIYTNVTTRFGAPSDVDGNGHINIVFYDMGVNADGGGVGGFFYPTNDADIIFINSNPTIADRISLGEIVAHEFQHLTYQAQKARLSGSGGDGSIVRDTKDLWLNESLAMFSSTISGYGTDSNSTIYGWLSKFFSESTYQLSLTHWAGDVAYGYATLFGAYLNDAYGKDITTRIYANLQASGIGALESATGEDFNDIFKNFAQAVYLSNTNMATDKKHKITTINIGRFTGGNRPGLVYKKQTTAGSSINDVILPYSFSLINIGGQSSGLTVTTPNNSDWSAYGGALQ